MRYVILPSTLATMRLGIHPAWVPPKPRPFVGSPVYPPAYGRIAAPRIAGDNQTLSDCFPTAACNAVIDIAARWGKTTTITDSDAVAAYKGMAGYDGTPATDLGTIPETGFAWWQRNTIGGWILAEATPIDPADEGEVRHAISCGPVIFCQALSIENQNQRVLTAVGTGGSWGNHATAMDEFDGAITEGTSWGAQFYLDRSFTSSRVMAVYALDVRLCA